MLLEHQSMISTGDQFSFGITGIHFKLHENRTHLFIIIMIFHNINIFSNISDQKYFAVLVSMIDFILKISKKKNISAPNFLTVY